MADKEYDEKSVIEVLEDLMIKKGALPKKQNLCRHRSKLNQYADRKAHAVGSSVSAKEISPSKPQKIKRLNTKFLVPMFIILLICVVLLTIPYLPSRGTPTGFFVKSDDIILQTQLVGWNITESQNRTLALETWADGFNLKSLDLKCTVFGTGKFKIFLIGEGKEYLIADGAVIQDNQNQSDIIEILERMDAFWGSEDTPVDAALNITTMIEYGDEPNWDTDNDGVAYIDDGVVDLTVNDTVFAVDLDESKLCTRWVVSSLDSGMDTTICKGAEDCCALVGVSAEDSAWNAQLYVLHGRYGATALNAVSAQVIFLNQSLSGGTYFESMIGTVATLPVGFIDKPQSSFSDICVETCSLPGGLDLDEYIMRFELDYDVDLWIESARLNIEQTTLTDPEDSVDGDAIEVDMRVKDSKNRTITASVEIRDSQGNIVGVSRSVESAEQKISGLGSLSSPAGMINAPGGIYDVTVDISDHPIESIEFDNLEISNLTKNFIRVDDVDETGAFANYIEVYAIDPTGLNFSGATVK